MRFNHKLPLYALGFVGLCALSILLIDQLIDIFLGQTLTEKLTLSHFSWHFSRLFSSASWVHFLEKITANKPGILANKGFYIFLMALFVGMSHLIFFVIFFVQNIPLSNTPESNKRQKKKWLQYFYCTVLLWFIVKQFVFVFIIPPWQTPDEQYHFLHSVALTTDDNSFMEILNDSVQKFEFMKYAEMDRVPYVFWRNRVYNFIRDYKKVFMSEKPPLFYTLMNRQINLFDRNNLLYPLYLGRLFSSLCIFLSSLILILLCKKIFTQPLLTPLTILSLLFFVSHPQLSYVGASFSGDALLILFSTCFFFFLFDLFNKKLSYRAILFSGFWAVLLTGLACFTKAPGFALIPILLISLTYSLCIRSTFTFRQGMLLVFFLIITFLVGIVLWFIFIQGSEFNFLKSFIEFLTRHHNHVFSTIYESLFSKTIIIYFVSFWISFGWMVYKASLGTYVFLGVVTGVIGVGLTRGWVNGSFKNMNHILPPALIFSVMIVLMGMAYGDPQGRRFFLGFSLFALVFAFGLYNFLPGKFQRNFPKFITLFFVALNMASVFGILIPAFYSN